MVISSTSKVNQKIIIILKCLTDLMIPNKDSNVKIK